MIDGCPSGLPLSEEEINAELARRRPGNHPFTSPRKELDRAEILSGVYEGVTTGSPISILIPNTDVDSSTYESIKHLLRPGHAQYPYEEKYGHVDLRGGGRASARETACRVAAGTVAKKLLAELGVELSAFLFQVGTISAPQPECRAIDSLRAAAVQSPIFCPNKETEQAILQALGKIKKEGDSLGGIVEFRAEGLSTTWGDPVYEKLDANLAKAMLSIPACKGVEIGAGFSSVTMRGSEHNDLFAKTPENKIITTSNHSGGILGGISNGMPLIIRAAFKPTSSITKPQSTLDKDGNRATMTLSTKARHDPCVAIRAVPVVEAMGALALADAFLMDRSVRLPLGCLASPSP